VVQALLLPAGGASAALPGGWLECLELAAGSVPLRTCGL
jgi:hypothetical protein